MTVRLSELTAYLDRYLRLRDIPDHENAVNGLQVENSGSVMNLVAAVDAWSAVIEAAGAQTPPQGTLLLVHHGLFWDGSHAIVGRQHRRIMGLLRRDIAVYSAHIPLDVHPEVGNNHVLARMLGLEDLTTFGLYRGVELGVSGTTPSSIRQRAALLQRVEQRLQLPPGAARLIPGGPETCRRVGVITGAGGSMVLSAQAEGVDTLVSGEGSHPSYIDAMEAGINVIYAGHYATETVGIKALAEHVGTRFGLPWRFLDRPTGM